MNRVLLISLALVLAISVGLIGCGEEILEYSLTISSAEGGEVTTPGEETFTYYEGEVIDLVAEAEEDYQFVNWTGDVDTIADVNAALTTITMNGDYSITANFTQGQLIRSWYDLDAIRDNLGASYRLMNDLDSTTPGYTELASPTANGGRGWEPIGTSRDKFTGSFNGHGYEIRDLFINRPGEYYVGLFSHIFWIHPIENLGCIENVGLVNADVHGGRWVGGLVGSNAGIVNNSYSTGRVHGGWDTGGLAGANSGTVDNSYCTSNVIGAYYVGGLVGSVTGQATVREGIVSNCYFTGSVTGATRVGGLLGSVLGDCTVSNSYSTGSVIGGLLVGGLVGLNTGASVSKSCCTGNVTGDRFVGGLVGLNDLGTISDSWSAGGVTEDSKAGGLVGYNKGGSVSNSFWDIEASRQATSDGGIGKTTAQMKDLATFIAVEWDIIAVPPGKNNDVFTWNIVNGETYSFLSWQSIS